MGAGVSITRRVAWIDTDAAGIWHHSTVVRWTEEAEAELHRDLGIIGETFGRTPRVSVSFEFRKPLAFDDEVRVDLVVSELGRTSVTYTISVFHDGALAVEGTMKAVLVDPQTGRPRPWPEHLRARLAG